MGVLFTIVLAAWIEVSNNIQSQTLPLKHWWGKKRHANNNEKNTVLTAPDSPSASQFCNLKQIPSSTSLNYIYILSAFKIQQVIWAPTACPSQPSNSWLSEPAMWRKVLLNLIDNKTADRWILLPPFDWVMLSTKVVFPNFPGDVSWTNTRMPKKQMAKEPKEEGRYAARQWICQQLTGPIKILYESN